jgi:60 kDa SS-A/Ro ribonucleoprotein
MKFNKKPSIVSSISNHKDLTENDAGGIAFKTDVKTELFLRTVSCLFGEPKYYKTVQESDDELIELIHVVAKQDPEFVLKLAVYSRDVMHLRTVPLVLLTEYANSMAVGKVKNARKYVPKIVKRVDEITELIAYQLARNKITDRKTKLPMMIKFGLADAFNNFNEYQFAKYNRDGEVKLKDALLLCHPKPSDENQQKLFDKIVSGTLETPKTWEVLTSTKGSTPEVWAEASTVMPYMALMRNLRNLLENKVNMTPIIKKLTDENLVLKSKQFPFRFYSAAREVERVNSVDTPLVVDALNEAMRISVQNLPVMNGVTYVVVDVSGSMNAGLSDKSSVKRKEIATLFGAITNTFAEKSIVAVFADICKSVPLMKSSSILDNQKKLSKINVGGNTNAHLAFEWLNTNKQFVDRIILFSDMQCWDTGGHYYYDKSMQKSVVEEFKKYRCNVNSDVYMYSCDLSGDGTIQIPQDTLNLALIGGWSDRIFEYISIFEKDKKTMMDDIEKISPKTF